MLKTNLAMTLAALTTTLAVGCTGGESEGEASARLSGDTVYRDASTDHAGATQPAATPPAQTAEVTIVVKGTGQIPQLDPQCSLDPAGQFEARYLTDLDIGGDQVYLATLAEGSGTIATPSGCAIPDLTVGLVTDVVIRAELAITTQNCQTYCEAHARAEAEAQCGASASAATCRSTAETRVSGECSTTCSTQAHAIVAETSLAASLFGDLDADALRAAALGELEADLTFEHLVDADGNRL